MEAMQSQSVDVVKRMKEITLVMQTPEQVLESQGVTPADIEGQTESETHSFIHCLFLSGFLFTYHHLLTLTDLLDELQEHVEAIDMANGQFFRYFTYYLISQMTESLSLCFFVRNAL